MIGGANVDVKARSSAPLLTGTSNPGHTVLVPGGVGRNVAENLARLGTPVALVSAVGADPLGDHLLAATAAAGVDVAEVRRSHAHPTGTYTATLAPDGELAVAVADMGAIDALRADDLPDGLIAGAALLVVDGNLAPAVVGHALRVAAASGVPVVVDPVSVPKAARLRPVLGGPVHTITPNRDELTALTAPDPDAPDPDVATAAARLHDRSVGLVWVRLGTEGSLLVGPDATTRLAPVHTPARDVVDVTGAGDAMLAAYCHALMGGAAPGEAAAYGHAAAALTVSVPETVHPALTDDLVRSLL